MQMMVGLQMLQGVITLSLAIIFGLTTARRTGLGGALVFDLTSVLDELRLVAPVSLLLGWSAGLAVSLLDFFILFPRVPALREGARRVMQLPFWQKLGAALYGGISEELIMRLGLFSICAWGVQRLMGIEGRALSIETLWLLNFAVAILFGVAHLPATATLAPLTWMVVTRALTFNGILSLLFGYLYFRHGLLAAMMAHLATDVCLQAAGTYEYRAEGENRRE
jgi:hypothetical protein